MIMKTHNKTHITLTPDDIKKAIEIYLLIDGLCDIKFIVEDTYQKESLTGYYKPELKRAEITVLE